MSEKAKEQIAREIAGRVQSGQKIGVGTGTTVTAVLEAIQGRITAEGLMVSVLPTSLQSAWKAEQVGLTVLDPGFGGTLDWSFDGADEVDPRMRLIKGRGGAMFQEKIVAEKSSHFVVIADATKIVSNLGECHPVPVEFVPSSKRLVHDALLALGAQEVILRECEFVGRSGPYFTQQGNLIFDARFSGILDGLESELNAITGVVENGLFLTQAAELVLADGESLSITMRES